MRNSYANIRKSCLKTDEAEKPIYAQIVTHWFSTRLIWLCQGLSFTPNFVSTLALFIAIAAIPFFAHMTPLSVLIGAILIEIYYVLDAVDGQWARLKQMKSLTGAFLDYFTNYAIHPPLMFAIGWGIYKVTNVDCYLVLGFLGGMSCLWVILIWNLRATIILEHLKHKGLAPKPSKYGKSTETQTTTSLPKKIFGVLHQTLVFPWFMSLLTITSVVAFIAATFFKNENLLVKLFGWFLYYYGIVGTLVAVLLTTHWILTKKLDHAPEI